MLRFGFVPAFRLLQGFLPVGGFDMAAAVGLAGGAARPGSGGWGQEYWDETTKLYYTVQSIGRPTRRTAVD